MEAYKLTRMLEEYNTFYQLRTEQLVERRVATQQQNELNQYSAECSKS